MSSRASITGLSGDTRAALTDTLPVGAGMVPLGVAFGILVTQAGLAWWWTPVISGLLFAGSLEFLLLSLMTAGASPAACSQWRARSPPPSWPPARCCCWP